MEDNQYLLKSRLTIELEYLAEFKLISDKFMEWDKAKPNNEELKRCMSALARIGIIVASYQLELQTVEKIVSEYRKDKLRYQKDAYEAAQKLSDYEKKYFDDEDNAK